MRITQCRAFGAGTGGGYGSFDRTSSVRDVERITSALSFGAHTTRRPGSFARSGVVRPDVLFTQLRAFGVHTGRRYGAFTRNAEPPAPAPAPTPSTVGPPRIVVLPVDSALEDDDVILLLASLPIAFPTNGGGSLH